MAGGGAVDAVGADATGALAADATGVGAEAEAAGCPCSSLPMRESRSTY